MPQDESGGRGTIFSQAQDGLGRLFKRRSP
jgi:hypothetical protein